VSTAQQVLDAIDAALDDPSVSGDAMRWTPQQEVDRRRIVAREHARRIHAIRVPPPLPPERLAVGEQLGERWLALVEALRPSLVALGEAMEKATAVQHRRPPRSLR
jgi:hypothetical protein